jgi:uncharacterized low-complexity protein
LRSARALLGTVMAANAANPFSLNDLGQGYQVGDKAGEGKCGTGSCGANKGKKCMEMKEKADRTSAWPTPRARKPLRRVGEAQGR